MSINNPREVPEAQALIRRLCSLQARVVDEVIGCDISSDCFCGDSGFWPLTSAEAFRNAGKAIDFIEEATLAALKKARA